MAVLTGLLMSNSGEKSHQKCVLSTSQINFHSFFIVSYLIKLMVLLLSLKWSWHKLPKCCRNQWSLQKVFVFVVTQFRRVTSVLLTEVNVYTIMFPYLPNPTKWRFPITIIEVQAQHCTKKEREILLQIPISHQLQGKYNLPIKFVFLILIVLKDFNCVWCKNTI